MTTVTTVGYGDITAHSTVEQVKASWCTITASLYCNASILSCIVCTCNMPWLLQLVVYLQSFSTLMQQVSFDKALLITPVLFSERAAAP